MQFAHLFLLRPRRLDFRRHLFVLYIGKASLLFSVFIDKLFI